MGRSAQESFRARCRIVFIDKKFKAAFKRLFLCLLWLIDTNCAILLSRATTLLRFDKYVSNADATVQKKRGSVSRAIFKH